MATGLDDVSRLDWEPRLGVLQGVPGLAYEPVPHGLAYEPVPHGLAPLLLPVDGQGWSPHGWPGDLQS